MVCRFGGHAVCVLCSLPAPVSPPPVVSPRPCSTGRINGEGDVAVPLGEEEEAEEGIDEAGFRGDGDRVIRQERVPRWSCAGGLNSPTVPIIASGPRKAVIRCATASRVTGSTSKGQEICASSVSLHRRPDKGMVARPKHIGREKRWKEADLSR